MATRCHTAWLCTKLCLCSNPVQLYRRATWGRKNINLGPQTLRVLGLKVEVSSQSLRLLKGSSPTFGYKNLQRMRQILYHMQVSGSGPIFGYKNLQRMRQILDHILLYGSSPIIGYINLQKMRQLY